jgi:NADH:ubiquinone oxidoreductase subunit 5 (subunit L)/multisubunit Na+/H+ antiporter MnhA subunit
MKIFLQLHFLFSTTILTIIFVAIFLAIQKVIRKNLSHETLKENHEIGGFIYNAVGIIYAVLIAFVVFAIWTGQQDTNSKIEQEASNLLDLYYDASVFPDSLKMTIQSTIRDYISRVTKDEWDSMADGNRDAEAMKSFIKLNRIYLSIDGNQLINKDILSEELKSMGDIREFRRHRLLSSRQNMPEILWIVILASSVIMIVFTFFFSTRNKRHQYIMTAFLVFVCVNVLYLIFVLDHPFTGVHAIKPEAFEPLMNIVRNFKK